MRHAASKYQGFKGDSPESAKLGLARRQGDKFPCEALDLDVKNAVFVSYGADQKRQDSSACK